jgi:hypothetical protein
MSEVLEKVHKFLTDHGVGLDSNIERNDSEVRVSIRDGMDDEPSQTAIDEAVRIRTALRKEFKDTIKMSIEPVDEWIDLTIEENI